MTARRAPGFTLLELLVVLAVLGLLMTMLNVGVDFGLRSWREESGTIDRRGDLEAVDRALRQLIEQMDPGRFDSPPTVDGAAHTLAFTTELPETVVWLRTRTADVALGVDAAHRLLLHWSAHLPGAAAGALPPETTVLLQRVHTLDIQYWREAPGGGGAWLDRWHDPALPALIRLRVKFPSGDRRHWPDLIAAPMRARPVVQRASTAAGVPA